MSDSPTLPGGPWQHAARAAGLLQAGHVRPTIFAEMTALAARTGAVNLGQGFPDADGPAAITRAAQDAIAAGVNQYPPGPGHPDLLRTIADSSGTTASVSIPRPRCWSPPVPPKPSPRPCSP